MSDCRSPAHAGPADARRGGPLPAATEPPPSHQPCPRNEIVGQPRSLAIAEALDPDNQAGQHCAVALRGIPDDPLRQDEIGPAEGVVLMGMNHCPGQVQGADEELPRVKRAQRHEWAVTVVRDVAWVTHRDGSPGHVRREHDDEVVVAGLSQVLVLSPSTLPTSWSTFKRVAVYPTPGSLSLLALMAREQRPCDAAPSQILLNIGSLAMCEGPASSSNGSR